MPFGQVVIGAPGAGKTTYCAGVQQWHSATGSRKAAVVNLDPANDSGDVLYECAVSISDLISHQEAMESQELGPNGAFLYVMEHLEKNMDWLRERLFAPALKDHYFVFDFPGQVELFIHHGSVRNILNVLMKEWGFQLVAVNLVDCVVLTNPTTYVSALLLCLSIMLHLELPHVNVLSKWDLIGSYGDLPFPLEFYTDVQDLNYLQNFLADVDELNAQAGTAAPLPVASDGATLTADDLRQRQVNTAPPVAATASLFGRKYRKLTGALCELVEEFSLVSFTPLDVQDKDSMHRLAVLLDKANGFAFGTENPTNYSILDIRDSGVTETRPAFERDVSIVERGRSDG
jgi:GPN-loop GTPase